MRYASSTKLFGLPLVSVAFGADKSRDERRGTARGFVAIGDVAVGCVAIGGVAVGPISIGGVAVGLLGLGGLAIGCWAYGGRGIGVFTGTAPRRRAIGSEAIINDHA